MLRKTGSHFCKFHFSENLRLFAQMNSALSALNFPMKPRSFKSGSRQERLVVNSTALKTTANKVQVGVTTSSCSMVPGLLREIRVLKLGTHLCYQPTRITRSDQSPSTTLSALMASPSLIRMGHYSGRLERLIKSMKEWRQLCWQRTKLLWV